MFLPLLIDPDAILGDVVGIVISALKQRGIGATVLGHAEALAHMTGHPSPLLPTQAPPATAPVVNIAEKLASQAEAQVAASINQQLGLAVPGTLAGALDELFPPQEVTPNAAK